MICCRWRSSRCWIGRRRFDVVVKKGMSEVEVEFIQLTLPDIVVFLSAEIFGLTSQLVRKKGQGRVSVFPFISYCF